MYIISNIFLKIFSDAGDMFNVTMNMKCEQSNTFNVGVNKGISYIFIRVIKWLTDSSLRIFWAIFFFYTCTESVVHHRQSMFVQLHIVKIMVTQKLNFVVSALFLHFILCGKYFAVNACYFETTAESSMYSIIKNYYNG